MTDVASPDFCGQRCSDILIFFQKPGDGSRLFMNFLVKVGLFYHIFLMKMCACLFFDKVMSVREIKSSKVNDVIVTPMRMLAGA